MNYIAIDGDMANFIDSMVEVTDEFQTDELRRYLANEGHAEADVRAALERWQASYFRQAGTDWRDFASLL